MPENKPKIIIVNEDDEIIGYKYRDDVNKSDIYRVSALWVKNSQGKYLLAQRALNKIHNPGQWGPAVAGTNDEGETYESNIIKEAEEEIGLKGIEFEKSFKLRRTGRLEGYNFFCQWFVATLNKDLNEFIIQMEEVEKLQWFNRNELEKAIKLKSRNFFSSMDYCLKNL